MSWTVNNGLSAADRAKLNSLLSVKNNLTATSPPTAADDSSKGYSASSIWLAMGTAYACVSADVGKAVWISSNDTFYFATYAQLVAAISVAGTDYIGKFCNVANANGGPSGGITYIAPGILNDYIVDGGSATYKVNLQGNNYSITCQPRTIVNPVVTSVMLIPANKPTVRGYYIFAVTPSNGLPPGINLNDVAYFDGTNWSLFQSYSNATTVLVANNVSGTTQVTWRKFAGTWMSTADEYNTDNVEYQTGKLWNGKAVFRKGVSGTTNASTTSLVTGITIPTTGKTVSLFGIINRNDGSDVMVTASGNEIMFDLERSTGRVLAWAGSTIYQGRPFSCWIEYTKS